jgi:hypothetical protein
MNSSFWNYYNLDAAPKLGKREKTFRKIFEYLDQIKESIIIVETGCTRISGNWEGDGQSTILFDKYISCRDRESVLFSVDLNKSSVDLCRSMVSSRSIVTHDDSVHYLTLLAARLQQESKYISFIYLDSFDLDLDYWQPSAIHHLKELTTVMRVINKKTLVVVDDCPFTADLVMSSGGNFSLFKPPKVGGKGRLVAELAIACGATLKFSDYQAGWVGF